MSIYAYQHCKVLDEVVFRRTANGALRAYIHACPQIEKGKVEEVLQAFKAKGYESIPFTVNGKPMLEVRGFKRESEFITMLSDNGYVDDKPTITQEAADKNSWGDLFRKRSLQLSGAAMMVADLGFIAYGAKNKRWEEALAGLAYLGGSATLLGYGRNDQSAFQIREGAQLILEHAKQKGYAIPEDTSAADVGGVRRDSVVRKVDNFFRQHPSEIGNMMYVAAGGLIAKSALQHRALAKPRDDMSAKQISEMRKGGWGDVGLGSVTIGSGLIATTVKEKAKDPDAEHHSGVGGIVDWIRESPLRAAGYGYIGSTLCHAYTTFVEHKEAKRVVNDKKVSLKERGHAQEHLNAIPWRVLFVTATLAGEVLLSISSKGHGEGVVSDSTVDDSIVAVAAELITKQPKHMQEALIQEMGKFLGMQDVLALKDDEAVDRLRRQVEEMRCNPWASKVPEAAPEAEKLNPAAVADKVVLAKEAVPAWQAKMAATDKGASLGAAV